MGLGIMKKSVISTIVVLALTALGLTMSLPASPTEDSNLRRVECRTLTMFTPSRKRSAESLCKNYGGVALKDAQPSKKGLIILVRNRPAGGFEGQE